MHIYTEKPLLSDKHNSVSRCSKLVYSQNGFILMQILFFFEGAMRAL